MKEIDSLQFHALELKKLGVHVQTKGSSIQMDREMMNQMVVDCMETAFNIDHLHGSIPELEEK